jgi:hypothetical protein
VERSTTQFHQLIEPVGHNGQAIEPAEQLIQPPGQLPVGQLIGITGQLMRPIGQRIQPGRQLMQPDRQLMQPEFSVVGKPRAFSPHSIDFILKKDKIN